MKHKKNEKGFALVLSLVLLMAMSLLGGSLIVVSSGDHRSNNTSDDYQQTFYVAETALIQGEKLIKNLRMGPWVTVEKYIAEAGIDVTSDPSWEEIQAQLRERAVSNGGSARNINRREYAQNKEDAESGLSGMTAIVSILALLLLGAGIAIVVLLRRDNSDESIFYDDDDEWEDESDEYVEKTTPILPPMAPSRPDMDAATKALDTMPVQTEVEESITESTVSDSTDPWADVDHSEEE